MQNQIPGTFFDRAMYQIILKRTMYELNVIYFKPNIRLQFILYAFYTMLPVPSRNLLRGPQKSRSCKKNFFSLLFYAHICHWQCQDQRWLLHMFKFHHFSQYAFLLHSVFVYLLCIHPFLFKLQWLNGLILDLCLITALITSIIWRKYTN